MEVLNLGGRAQFLKRGGPVKFCILTIKGTGLFNNPQHNVDFNKKERGPGRSPGEIFHPFFANEQMISTVEPI